VGWGLTGGGGLTILNWGWCAVSLVVSARTCLSASVVPKGGSMPWVSSRSSLAASSSSGRLDGSGSVCVWVEDVTMASVCVPKVFIGVGFFGFGGRYSPLLTMRKASLAVSGSIAPVGPVREMDT